MTFLQNLDQRFPIVDPKTGQPTDYFLRLLRAQTGELADDLTTVQEDLEALEQRNLVAGAGLTGGGNLEADRTFNVGAGTGVTVNANDVALSDTAVTPGSYTNTNLTVDQQGRITAAASGAAAGGDVVGPSSSIDNQMVRFDLTTGKLIQVAQGIQDDTGRVTVYNDAGNTGFTGEAYGSGGNTNTQNVLARARGTHASPTKIIAGDIIGRLLFRGYSGTSFTTGGAIAEVRGVAVQDGDAGGSRLSFWTIPNGGVSTDLAERLRVEQNGEVIAYVGIVPDANDGAYLGTTALGWSDMFFASGGVINWNNGNATITHSPGLLTSNVDIAVPDEAYGSGWNGSLEAPTKNAVYDKIETVTGGGLIASVRDTFAVAQTNGGSFGSRGGLYLPTENCTIKGLVFAFLPEAGATAGYDAEIVTLNGSNIVQTIVATANRTGIAATLAAYEFVFSSPVSITAGTRYGILLTRRTVSGSAAWTMYGTTTTGVLQNAGLALIDTYIRATVNQCTVGQTYTTGSNSYWFGAKV